MPLVISIESGLILWIQILVRAVVGGAFVAYEIDIETCISQLEPEIIAIRYMMTEALGPGISHGQDLHGLSVCGLGNQHGDRDGDPDQSLHCILGSAIQATSFLPFESFLSIGNGCEDVCFWPNSEQNDTEKQA